MLICELILVGSVWVNPCTVNFLEPEIHRGYGKHYTHCKVLGNSTFVRINNISCDKVVKKLNELKEKKNEQDS